MVKLIALDLDGTLLMPDHDTVSEENICALKEASAKGIKIAIASGRTYGVFSRGVMDLDVVDFAIMSNGAAIMTFNKEAEDHDRRAEGRIPVTEMPYELWCDVFDVMTKYGADPEIYAFGASHMDRKYAHRYASGLLTPALVEELKSHINFVDDVHELLRGQSIEKICNLTVPHGNRDALVKELSGNDRISVTTAIPGNVEVNLAGTNKGNALCILCEKLGISPDEVMAMGDAENDLEMLRFVGYSVAMGNASDEVKSVARYETDTNDRHGVAKAIRKYAL